MDLTSPGFFGRRLPTEDRNKPFRITDLAIKFIEAPSHTICATFPSIGNMTKSSNTFGFLIDSSIDNNCLFTPLVCYTTGLQIPCDLRCFHRPDVFESVNFITEFLQTMHCANNLHFTHFENFEEGSLVDIDTFTFPFPPNIWPDSSEHLS
jgi:hypothetical protein